MVIKEIFEVKFQCSPSCKNQSIDLQSKVLIWFLYEGSAGCKWVNKRYIKVPWTLIAVKEVFKGYL